MLCETTSVSHIEDLMNRLLILSKEIIRESMPLMSSIAIDHQSLLFWRKKNCFWKRTSLCDPLFPIMFVDQIRGDLFSYLSTSPFVLPFICVSTEALNHIVSRLDSRYILSVSKDAHFVNTTIEYTKIGHANCYPWNGIFQREPLFSKEG